MCYVVFFKQKTAYEMRIRDWSSDVCSSDLQLVHVAQGGGEGFYGCGLAGQWGGAHDWPPVALAMAARAVCQIELSTDGSMPYVSQTSCSASRRSGAAARSEEHTSELQSLMRISYAVFCLKKKTNKYKNEKQRSIRNGY